MTETGDTRTSLLLRARQGDEDAWRRLVDLYRPLVYAWLVRHQVATQDAEDLTQDVLAVVIKELGRFEHAGRPGAFRAWLRTILINQVRHFLRGQRHRLALGSPQPGSDWLEQLADPHSGLSQQWDQEHDQQLARRFLAIIQAEFNAATWQVFQMLVLEDRPAAEVAQQLGLTRNAVYVAKARVLARLRAELRGLMEV